MSIKDIETELDKAKGNLKKWFNETTDQDEKFYAVEHAKWTSEKVFKNEYIRKKNADQSQRKRKSVYWTELGMNVGSELCESHFSVVIKEFEKTAVVIPLSSVKEDDEKNGWKTEANGYYKIGLINDLPNEKRETYAVVSQIKTVSKKRLTDYKDPETKKYIRMKLNDDQMTIIDGAVKKLYSKLK